MRPGKTPVGAANGFTLLEILFSTFFLLVALLGIAASTTLFSKVRQVTEENQIAKEGARNQLDLIRGSTFNQILATFNNNNFQVDLNADGIPDLRPQPGDADQNVGRVTITQNPLATSLLEVVVDVNWQGVSGNRNYQITTLITDHSVGAGP